MHQWIGEELTGEQKRKKWNQKTSIFDAFVNNNYGGKLFVMAVWQTGITWLPLAELRQCNYVGATEHFATEFARWAHAFLEAVKAHKNNPATEEARRKSGTRLFL